MLAIYTSDSLDSKYSFRNINNVGKSESPTNEDINSNSNQQSYYAIRNLDFSKIDTTNLSKNTVDYNWVIKSLRKVYNFIEFQFNLIQILPYTVNDLPIYNFLGVGIKFKTYKNIFIGFQYSWNLNINNSNHIIDGTNIFLSYKPPNYRFKKFFVEPALKYSNFRFKQTSEDKNYNIESVVGSLQFHFKIKRFRFGIEPFYNYPFNKTNEVINNTSFGIGLNWIFIPFKKL